MNDLISRQALCEYALNQKDKSVTPNDIMRFPSAQPVDKDIDIPVKDIISRQATIDEIEERKNANGYCNVAVISELNRLEGHIMRLPSAQPTLYGYDIEHLILIANVLKKENLPPERVVEALTDIGRIVSIVKDEFEESLRKVVEQCKI